MAFLESAYLGKMSLTAWNLGELRKHLGSVGKNVDFTNEVLRSLGRNASIFRYHMATARDALKGIVDEEHPNIPENIRLIFGDSDKSDEFNFARLVSEAHLIGCLHTARAMWDHFAQLLNLVVLDSLIPIYECDISKILKRLPECELQIHISSTLSSHWYKYVAAFVNTSKHRQLIEHSFSTSIEANRAGVKVGAFSYHGIDFPAYWGTEALEGAIEVKNRVIEAGSLLNKAVLPNLR